MVLFISGLVVAPLMEDEPADPENPEGDVSPEERREASLDALEELQFEHETGKLSDEDYRRLRNRYARAAVQARREEEGEGEASPCAPSAGDVDGAPVRCPDCGREAEADARFCGRCGAELPA